ncbi:hypothetical protein C8J57DRAFT_1240243 [Mycena rebaudengoi]|nr:hypothetical protein C8J57DRAFT_1240243 [Mycena rebaudengoi]
MVVLLHFLLAVSTHMPRSAPSSPDTATPRIPTAPTPMRSVPFDAHYAHGANPHAHVLPPPLRAPLASVSIHGAADKLVHRCHGEKKQEGGNLVSRATGRGDYTVCVGGPGVAREAGKTGETGGKVARDRSVGPRNRIDILCSNIRAKLIWSREVKVCVSMGESGRGRPARDKRGHRDRRMREIPRREESASGHGQTRSQKEAWVKGKEQMRPEATQNERTLRATLARG